jgi:hypothetical protein
MARWMRTNQYGRTAITKPKNTHGIITRYQVALCCGTIPATNTNEDIDT